MFQLTLLILPPHTHTDPTKLLMIPIVSDPDVEVTVTSMYNPISNSLSFTIVITERGHLSGQWTPGAVVLETDLTLNVSIVKEEHHSKPFF